MSLQRYILIRDITIIVLLLALFIYGNTLLFVVAFSCAFVFMSLRALIIQSKKRMKMYFITSYAVILLLQILFSVLVIFGQHTIIFAFYICKFFGLLSVLVPFFIERYMTINKYVSFYLPSLQEISVVSFAEIKSNKDKLLGAIDGANRAGDSMSWQNIKSVAVDIQRTNSFKYISNGALSDEYFELAYNSLDDPYLYVVLSRTGSAAGEIISLFTKKLYSHASLSFDYDLKTIISYNGGERVYPPGLNRELIEHFNKKNGSSIIVYKIKATEQQKRMIIDKIKEINIEGSAYNLMGIVLKYTHKPNIMFCSQFVYKMLKYAGLQYFDKKEEAVKPMDLVELDYHRKLEFAYEIALPEQTPQSVSGSDTSIETAILRNIPKATP